MSASGKPIFLFIQLLGVYTCFFTVSVFDLLDWLNAPLFYPSLKEHMSSIKAAHVCVQNTSSRIDRSFYDLFEEFQNFIHLTHSSAHMSCLSEYDNIYVWGPGGLGGVGSGA